MNGICVALYPRLKVTQAGVWAQFDHFEANSEEVGKEKSSEGKAATH
jgi:hypothetical protein